jgi:putative Ca2+/H+ antiporter (TMEM165/GDT1 family)
MVDVAVLGVAFLSIFLVELPDKTFLATLVLSTKYRPLYVWIGVGAAFGVQTMLAVIAGGVVSLLPHDFIHAVAGLMFLIGGVMLIREGMAHRDAREEEEDEEAELAERAKPATGLRQIGAAFLVLFAAEWGDLSQLLTVSLVAKYKSPGSVFLGAFIALLVVSGMAVVLGKQALRYIRLDVLHFLGAAVCLILGAITFSTVLA